MIHRRFLLALILVTGCGLTPGAAPFHNQLAATVTFDTPSSFDNPGNSEGYFNGNWVVQDGAYVQAEPSANNYITIRRYTGGGWGSRGEAPDRYRSEVQIQAYKESEAPQLLGYPVGILSYIPYFRDSKHYVVLVATPTSTGGMKVEAWAVNGYAPGVAWPQEACLMSEWMTTPCAVGTPVTLGATVDTREHSIRVAINGEEQEKVSSPMITGGKHWVALVSNGNYVQFDNLRLYK
ncbi:MAG: hypothetical protein ACM3YO_08785 [Bacteroidota bacterium]